MPRTATAPEIPAREYAQRRRQLMRIMGRGAIAVLPTAAEQPRNRDVDFPFRPDSDFHYLTGFPEPEAVAVLIPGRKEGEFILFCRDRDPDQETWHGRRAGPQGAVAQYGADDAYPIDDIDEILPGLLEGREQVWYSLGLRPDFDEQLLAWLNQLRQRARGGVRTPGEVISLEHSLHDMRLYKSAAEIRVMRHAARIAARAHTRAMQRCRPGLHEYQVEAEFIHEFRQHDCSHAYPPIVGGGDNACILHYTENRSQLLEGQLLLIDAGAEYRCYASDITRTFPVSGRFSAAQRELYELVLAAQLAAIEQVRPGNHWNAPHEAAVKVLTRGLVRLGLLKGQPARLIRDEAYKPYYMHRTGHWLGMDVHDVGDYKIDGLWRELEPGMVLTVEPGLYIAPGSRGVPRRYWGIGIRIEDDVLVTREGPDVLSRDVVKDPDAIEALMAAAPA